MARWAQGCLCAEVSDSGSSALFYQYTWNRLGAWLGSGRFMGYISGMTTASDIDLGFSEADLKKLAEWRMPFGIYAGRVLIDLPEEYLFWFTRHGFPDGELGKLMQLCLDLKVEGLDALIKPLKRSAQDCSE